MTADGVELVTHPIRELGDAQIDTLIVPGAFVIDNVTGDGELVQCVRDIAPRCRRVCSACVGSFLLAAAGVFDGARRNTLDVRSAARFQPSPGNR